MEEAEEEALEYEKMRTKLMLNEQTAAAVHSVRSAVPVSPDGSPPYVASLNLHFENSQSL
jgi:hypothetical protein